jgi:coenzyme F420-reducing hydrogenase delta subunit
LNTRTFISDRLREEFYIKECVNNTINEVFILNEGVSIDNIKEKAKEYFEKLKKEYDSLSDSGKKKLKNLAVISLLGTIGLSGGLEPDLKADTTDVNHAKVELSNMADDILDSDEFKSVKINNPYDKTKSKKDKQTPLSYDNYIIATTLVGEAGGEGEAGMKAVANVLKNRAKASKQNIANVALEPKQFSMWNSHTIDGEKVQNVHKEFVKDAYPNNDKVWKKAIEITKNIKSLKDNTGGATSYYNPDVASPDWGVGSKTWETTKKIGKHLFGIDGSSSKYEL